jgi:L-threonylcarbamoyladenylate synthase
MNLAGDPLADPVMAPCRAIDTASIAEAARLLAGGGLVAFPTETVYGLGADATNAPAIARLYAAKGRPTFNPLIAHVANRAAAMREGVFSPLAAKLAEHFWPGPLTLVVPLARGGRSCDLARAGLATIGLRVPADPAALALLVEVGRPIAAPSANRSGRISPVSAEDVQDELGTRVDLILDGGSCRIGVESTIVACIDERPRLLRPGGIPRATIEAVFGRPLATTPTAKPDMLIAPGMLASHYAPSAALRLDAAGLRPGEAGLDFGGRFTPGKHVLDLSPRGDTVEAAANLYGYLRRLDATGAEVIAVAPVPGDGLGEAVRDRLERAGAPR